MSDTASVPPHPADDIVVTVPVSTFNSEDGWAIWLGALILFGSLILVWVSRPGDVEQRAANILDLRERADELAARDGSDAEEVKRLHAEIDAAKKKLVVNPLRPWMGKLNSWEANPREAFFDKSGQSVWLGLLGIWLVGLVLFGLGRSAIGLPMAMFPLAFTAVFLLAVLAQLLAGQEVIKYYNLEYALWALVVGLLICNTVGTPKWLRAAVQTEFYIKTGLVLLGAEVLVNRLLELGLPGVFVAWVVTPIVLITTYIFGQKVLRIPSRSLNMVICADMSVCGVSAAIATAAACRAKKEELSLAIGMSLTFTVVMMIVMPMVIQAVGMSPVLGGAWIGGTIDSTGAVAAAGMMLGDTALAVAATVKMIQNILIGVIAFGVAVYWVTYVEKVPGAPLPGLGEIWRRFPKFVLGFVGVSLVFSWLQTRGLESQAITAAVTSDISSVLRGWFFCLAFVSIGLETNVRQLRRYLSGGKPIVLYACGQTLNILLTLAMAWLMFEKVFPHAANVLAK
ncbi:MAG: YeiH family protein [Pirellulaceae bacterium]